MKNLIQLFEDKKIRTLFDEEKQEWYFSAVDVCAVLSQTQSVAPRNYWSDLKRRLKSEESQLHAKIVQLKMQSSDGKMYLTDALNLNGILRVIQLIPSKKAEPFKMWIAKVAGKKITEVQQAKAAAKANEPGNTENAKTNKIRKTKIILLGLGISVILAAAIILLVIMT